MSSLNLPSNFRPDRVTSILQVPPRVRHTLVELEGPGCVRHIWMCVPPRPMQSRKLILRIYWDGEPSPSVEAPIGDFFGVCHGLPFYHINSRYLSVTSQSGYNCYFPMPFGRSARFEVEAEEEGCWLYFHIDWHRYSPGALSELQRFHAKWRREFPTQRYGEEYLVMDAVGEGRLLGLVYGVRLYDDVDRWSHGGGENIYIDGEESPAFIRGSGGEDTFGTSFGGALHTPETHLFVGMPYYLHEDVSQARPAQRLVGYRFYHEEAITFRRSLHFRFGCMQNDICSTAYWYQTEPHREFFRMPPFEKLRPGVELKRGEYDLFDESGGEWWLCGPFENRNGKGMKAVLPPEEDFDPKATYDGGFEEGSPWLHPSGPPEQRRARWVRRREIHHFVDFNHVFRAWARGVSLSWPAVAYALTWLESPRDTEAQIHLAWDDEARLWLNEQPILHEHHPVGVRSREIPVRLRAGRNRLLLKLSNDLSFTWGAWCFAFRAVLPDGTLLKPQVE